MVMGVSSSSRVDIGGGIGGGGGGDEGESPYVNVRLGSNGCGYEIETASQNGDDDCCGGCKRWWTRLCKGVRDFFARGARGFTEAHMRAYNRGLQTQGQQEDGEDIFGYVGQFPKPFKGRKPGDGGGDDVTYATLKIGQPQGDPQRPPSPLGAEGGGDNETVYSDVRVGGKHKGGRRHDGGPRQGGRHDGGRRRDGGSGGSDIYENVGTSRGGVGSSGPGAGEPEHYPGPGNGDPYAKVKRTKF